MPTLDPSPLLSSSPSSPSSPPLTKVDSPELRPTSQASSVAPSLASGATASTWSSISTRSVSDSSSPRSRSRRRHGFMRPQGTEFADSARNRDSVMCLGSIAALQYYFARTGLLDGKGAQFAKESTIPKDRKEAAEKAAEKAAEAENASEGQDTEFIWETMPVPAISTYRHKEPITQPLPDMPLLRRQLREALDDAQKVLEATPPGQEGIMYEESIAEVLEERRGRSEVPSRDEAQGLQILDVVTLAIRQARTYYISHTQPQYLDALKPERQIRSDLYQVLDILKRMASRDFRGGIRTDERSGILSWIQDIRNLLRDEEKQEHEELLRIRHSPWRGGDWTGREREREWHFLKSFDTDPSPLPAWEPTSPQPSPFLLTLSKGLRLISLHNEMVRRSTRPFGQIKTFYTDLAKPYRCAENLRYWAKAAELRWEIKLSFDALEVVHGDNEQAWLDFDQAVQTWCKGVREELSREWAEINSRPSTGTEVQSA